MWLSRSDDGGRSFSAPVAVTGEDERGRRDLDGDGDPVRGRPTATCSCPSSTTARPSGPRSTSRRGTGTVNHGASARQTAAAADHPFGRRWPLLVAQRAGGPAHRRVLRDPGRPGRGGGPPARRPPAPSGSKVTGQLRRRAGPDRVGLHRRRGHLLEGPQDLTTTGSRPAAARTSPPASPPTPAGRSTPPGTPAPRAGPGVYHATSDDDGTTWSRPRRLLSDDWVPCRRRPPGGRRPRAPPGWRSRTAGTSRRTASRSCGSRPAGPSTPRRPGRAGRPTWPRPATASSSPGACGPTATWSGRQRGPGPPREGAGSAES